MNQVKLPEIVWASNGFATETAQVDGVAIGHVALRGRPDYDDAYEVVLYNSEGEKNSWSGKPEPAATAHVGPEQDKATFLKMVEEALERGTPSDVLTIMKRNLQRNGSFPERVRFNWGFHDGTAEAERAAVRDMESHHDRAYVHGYVRGVLAWKNLGYRPETSDEAWLAYQNHPIAGQATGKQPEAQSPVVAFERKVNEALEATVGMKVTFSSMLQERSECNAVYHTHSGQQAAIIGVGINPEQEGEWDEEALPFIRVRFDDGVEVTAFGEELFSNDKRFFVLYTAVLCGYGAARELDVSYAGPYHLEAEGSAEDKQKYLRALDGLQPVTQCDQQPWTPEEFRVTSWGQGGKPLETNTLDQLYRLWDRLGDVRTNLDQNSISCIDETFEHFSKGTPCEEIWHWFEAQHPGFIVGEVMQGIRRADGAQGDRKPPEISVTVPARSPKSYRVEVTGGGDLDKSPGVAIFDVSEESARNIIKLSSVVRANDLHKVEKCDCRAQYLQYDPETDPDDALDAGEENAVRSECDMLVVTDDAFYFRAYVKHTDVAVECASQSIAELAAHFAIPFEDPRHMQGNSSSPTT